MYVVLWWSFILTLMNIRAPNLQVINLKAQNAFDKENPVPYCQSSASQVVCHSQSSVIMSVCHQNHSVGRLVCETEKLV
jgi:hypothetical protein